MTKIYDLSQGNMGELARQQHRDQYATPLNGASVGSGGTRYYGTGQLRVENQGLVVTGSAEIIGQLIGTGALAWSGPFTVTGATSLNGETTVGGNTTVNGEFTTNGALDVNGPTTLAGALDITGRTDISGDVVVDGSMTTNGPVNITGETTLTGDLNVVGSGNIEVGNVLLTPSAGNGGVQFQSGGGVGGSGGAVLLRGTSNAGVLADSGASLFSGAYSVDARPDGIYLTNLPTTSEPANIHVTSGGKVFRSTA